MHTKEGREGILWEFHRSDLSAPAACRSLPLFPNKDNLHAWLKLEEAGKLTACEMPGRAERMHCSHGEGSPAFAARRAGAAPASPRRRRAEGGRGQNEEDRARRGRWRGTRADGMAGTGAWRGFRTTPPSTPAWPRSGSTTLEYGKDSTKKLRRVRTPET